MKITVTSTSQTLSQLLSAEDYAIIKGYFTTQGGGIFHNAWLNRVYIETGKAATATDSYYIDPGEDLSVGFFQDIKATQFKTPSGTSDLLMLF